MLEIEKETIFLHSQFWGTLVPKLHFQLKFLNI